MPRTAHLLDSDIAHSTRQPIPVLDTDTPTVTRNLTASLASDLAACHGVREWSEVDPETRASTRIALVRHFTSRMLDARGAMSRNPSLENAERVLRMERGLAAARRLG